MAGYSDTDTGGHLWKGLFFAYFLLIFYNVCLYT